MATCYISARGLLEGTMRNFLVDFRRFIARGDVLDLAVAVVIGTAFGAITTSLVDDILMPPIGFLISGVDFQDLALRLNDELSSATGRS